MLEVYCLSSGLGVSIVGLERALLQYTKEPTVTPFDIKTVPIDTTPLIPKQSKTYTSICIYHMLYKHLSCMLSYKQTEYIAERFDSW